MAATTTTKPISLLIIITTFLLCLLLCTMTAAASGGRMVGGRTPVEDVKRNEEVQELGRFSVEEYNRRNQNTRGGNSVYGDLAFTEVIAAEKQVVSGFKYYMKIKVATKGGESKVFDSVVVVKPWMHSKELLDFAPHRHD